MSTRQGSLVAMLFLLGAAVTLVSFGSSSPFGSAPHGPKPPVTITTVVGSDPCTNVQGTVPTYYSQQVHDGRFGPPAPFETDQAQVAFHATLCLDPATEIADHEAVDGNFSSPEDRANKTRMFAADPIAFHQDVLAMEQELSKAKEVRVEVHSGPYKTLFATTDNDVPEVFQGDGSFTAARHVLVFDFGDHQVSFVLECHFQPEQIEEFPNVPTSPPHTPPPPPSCTSNCTPPCTENCGSSSCTSNCTPPCTSNCTPCTHDCTPCVTNCTPCSNCGKHDDGAVGNPADTQVQGGSSGTASGPHSAPVTNPPPPPPPPPAAPPPPTTAPHEDPPPTTLPAPPHEDPPPTTTTPTGSCPSCPGA